MPVEDFVHWVVLWEAFIHDKQKFLSQVSGDIAVLWRLVPGDLSFSGFVLSRVPPCRMFFSNPWVWLLVAHGHTINCCLASCTACSFIERSKATSLEANKKIVTFLVFKSNGVKITMEANKKIVNFLDVTFDL